MAVESPTPADMDAAAQRLSDELTRRRAHLNEVTESVFVSHAGQPVKTVLVALMLKADTGAVHVQPEDLYDAANAISLGRRFAFV